MGVRLRAALAGAFLAFSAVSAQAVRPDEILPDPALESRARDLSTGLRCMVCQNQSIDESDAPLARDLRLIVRERLSAGDSDAQVLDYLVARYGQFVLLRPRFEAETLILWAAPVLLLGFGGAFALVSARRRRSAAEPIALTPDEEAALARALDERR